MHASEERPYSSAPASKSRFYHFLSIAATALLPSSAHALTLLNPSFETPSVLSSQYNVPGASWAFKYNSGIANNSMGAPATPYGSQAAFIQGNTNLSFFTQNLSLSADTYEISCFAAKRAGYPANPLAVYVDGVSLGSNITVTAESFTQFILPVVTVTAGTHQIAFKGLGTDQSQWVLIDNVTITAVANVVLDFGAVGDGVHDDTPNIQNAINSSYNKIWFPPNKTYRMNSSASITRANGWKVLYGAGDASVIKSDGYVFMLQDTTDTQICNLRLGNITTPYLIYRWGDTVGYQPTPNDDDIWPTLSASQQNQDIGPKIYVAGGNNISVFGITGDFVTLEFANTSNSRATDCNFRGGKNFAGGILLWGGAGLVNSNNVILRNTVHHASLSGICTAAAQDCLVASNHCNWNGESGIKAWSDYGDPYRTCVRMTYDNNIADHNWYDGIELLPIEAQDPEFDSSGGQGPAHGSIVRNNISTNNRKTGYYNCGKYWTYSNNTAQSNGTGGFQIYSDYSSFTGNATTNNNLSNTPTGYHEVAFVGHTNTITGNTMYRYSTNIHGSALWNGDGLYTSKLNTYATNTLINCLLWLYDH